MKKLKWLMPCGIFLLLILIAFRKFIFTPGIVGHTWDWGMPHFKAQYIDKLKNLLFIWDDTISGGRFLYFKFELFYWIIVFPISLLGAELASKIIPVVFLLFSALSMYKLCKYYRLSSFWSTVAGIFYMFSPIAYSRVVAGHLTVLLCYSLLPVLVIFLQKIIDNIRNRKKVFYRDIFLASLFFMIQILVHPMAIIAGILLVVFFGWYVFFSVYKWRLIKIFGVVALLTILMNIFWLLPGIYDYCSTKSIGFGVGVNYSGAERFTVEKELSLREQYVKSTQQPVYNSIRICSRIGMDTDYVWPIPNKWKLIWAIISFSICLLFFGILFKQNLSNLYVIGPYIVMSIIGIILVSGYYTFFGDLIYRMLAKYFPLVYMDISRTTRMLIILCLTYSVGVCYVLCDIENYIKRKWIFRSIGICGLAIFILPFINGDITKPLYEGITQPHSLRVNEINPEDRFVYKFFKKNPDDFRLTYLPPTMISWPGFTDLSYEWNVMLGLSPKPEFLGYPETASLSYDITQDLYSLSPSPYLGKLLGLANVKYIVYPHYDFFVSYRDFIPEYNPKITVEGFKDYKPIVDENLKKQEGLIEMNTNFNTVTIFENKWFLPHIYATEDESLVFADKDSFTRLSYSDCFEELPAAIFIDNDMRGIGKLLDAKMRGQGINNVFVILSENINTRDFYAPYTKDYIVQVKMKPNYVLKDVIEDSFQLDITSSEGILNWNIMPNMTTYSYSLSNEMGVIFNCYFNGKPNEDEFIRLRREGLAVDLIKYPLLEMEYKVDDGRVQTIEVIAILDFNRDGIADEHINMGYDYPAAEYFYRHILNVYGEAKKRFPAKKYYDLVGLELFPHKYWKTDCESSPYKGIYKFYLKDPEFVKFKPNRFIKSMDNSPENIWGNPEEERRKWAIAKIAYPAQAEVLERGVVFKKSKKKIECSRKINIDVSKFKYIRLNYCASPFNVERIMLLIDLNDEKDFYLTDLPISSKIQDVNINVYEYLANFRFEPKDLIVKSVKIWIEEKTDTTTKSSDDAIIAGQGEDNMQIKRDNIFYLRELSFYSLDLLEEIIVNKPIIAIDNDVRSYEYKLHSRDETKELYVQYKTRIERGWHKFCWLLHPDEYFKLDWTMLSFDKSNEVKDIKASLSTTFTKINPTKYIVDIAYVEKPFWLVFLENYNEGWRAYIKPKIVPLKTGQNSKTGRWWEHSAILTWVKTKGMRKLGTHFEINGYANGWWINPSEMQNSNNFEVIIVFKPQRYYELGLFMAGLIIIGGIGIVLADWFKRKG